MADGNEKMTIKLKDTPGQGQQDTKARVSRGTGFDAMWYKALEEDGVKEGFKRDIAIAFMR